MQPRTYAAWQRIPQTCGRAHQDRYCFRFRQMAWHPAEAFAGSSAFSPSSSWTASSAGAGKTAFSAAGKALDKNILAEIVYCFDYIPLAEYALPGSKELVENTSKFFKDFDVVLMANHGVIVGGKDVKDAYLKLELCEAYAQTVLFSNLLGGAKMLPSEEVKKIYSLR